MKKVVLNQILGVTLACSLLPGAAWAHGEGKTDTPRKISTAEKPFGREGDPKKFTRTIRVAMADTMRYSPMQITVKRGETVRFVAQNAGKVMHEMVLGTMPELQEHFELMKQFPGMEHDEPHMTHVKPGKSAQMVWQFTKAGEFYYGCLVPGHFEAGMIGRVIVK